MFLNEFFECFGIRVDDNQQAALLKTYRRAQCYGDGRNYLALALRLHLPCCMPPKKVFVHHCMADSAPERLQHRPCCLIWKNPRIRYRVMAEKLFLAKVKCCSQAYAQCCSGAMKDRARSRGNVVASRIVPPFPVFHAPALGAMAQLTLHVGFPAKPAKIDETRSIIRELRHKFGVVARVINSSFGRMLMFGGELLFYWIIIALSKLRVYHILRMIQLFIASIAALYFA